MLSSILGFPGGSEGKESSCNAGHVGLILGRLPGERNGYPLQYSFPENPMNRGAWQAAVHGVSKSRTRLSVLTEDTLLDVVTVDTRHYAFSKTHRMYDTKCEP